MSEAPYLHVQLTRMNEPMKMFFFGAGQVIGFMLMFSIGGMANSPLIGAGFGFLLAYAIGKTSSKQHRSFWKHCIYWFTPGRFGLNWMPDSSDRQVVR